MPAKLNILLIEDDLDDIEFLKVALTDNSVSFSLETLTQGDMIINWLKTTTKSPDIIVMDLNLPKLHGREVLCRIKEDERFKNIPLVVLTTSSSVTDKEYCLRNGADKFISKPSTTEGFSELVNDMIRVAGINRRAN